MGMTISKEEWGRGRERRERKRESKR